MVSRNQSHRRAHPRSTDLHRDAGTQEHRPAERPGTSPATDAEYRLPSGDGGKAEPDDREAGDLTGDRDAIEQGEADEPQRHPQRDEDAGKAEQEPAGTKMPSDSGCSSVCGSSTCP